MERAAVLRVQRKRGGAEPAEALLLACKRLRAEPGQGAPVERGVFKLVATVSSKVPLGSSGRRRPRGWVRVGRAGAGAGAGGAGAGAGAGAGEADAGAEFGC